MRKLALLCNQIRVCVWFGLVFQGYVIIVNLVILVSLDGVLLRSLTATTFSLMDGFVIVYSW
jgi:hypothetical protein